MISSLLVPPGKKISDMLVGSSLEWKGLCIVFLFTTNESLIKTGYGGLLQQLG